MRESRVRGLPLQYLAPAFDAAFDAGVLDGAFGAFGCFGTRGGTFEDEAVLTASRRVRKACISFTYSPWADSQRGSTRGENGDWASLSARWLVTREGGAPRPVSNQAASRYPRSPAS